MLTVKLQLKSEPMRAIIAGSRGVTDYNLVCEAVHLSQIIPTVVVSGTCHGVDKLGERYGDEHGIPVDRYPAKWRVNGLFIKSAGYIRNKEMAENADALIAIWDGVSPGTRSMIEIARRKGLIVYVYKLTLAQSLAQSLSKPVPLLPLDFFD